MAGVCWGVNVVVGWERCADIGKCTRYVRRVGLLWLGIIVGDEVVVFDVLCRS